MSSASPPPHPVWPDGAGTLLHALKNSMQVLHGLCSLHGRALNDKTGRSVLTRLKAALMIVSDAADLLRSCTSPGAAELLPLNMFLERALMRIGAAHNERGALPPIELALPDALLPLHLLISWALLTNEVVGQLLLTDGGAEESSVMLSARGDASKVEFVISVEPHQKSGRESSATPSTSAEQSPTPFPDLGPVGPALVRQTSAVVKFITQQPTQVSITFPIPQ